MIAVVDLAVVLSILVLIVLPAIFSFWAAGAKAMMDSMGFGMMLAMGLFWILLIAVLVLAIGEVQAAERRGVAPCRRHLPQ